MSASASGSSRAAAPGTTPLIADISSLDQEGRGIARIDGKAVFVEGALPGETVAITYLKKKPTFDIARADAVLKANAARVEPRSSTSMPQPRSRRSSARSRMRCGASAESGRRCCCRRSMGLRGTTATGLACR